VDQSVTARVLAARDRYDAVVSTDLRQGGREKVPASSAVKDKQSVPRAVTPMLHQGGTGTCVLGLLQSNSDAGMDIHRLSNSDITTRGKTYA
jgi:hypothetical protein